ncbi:hypothetical protein KKF91_07290 [Myxococcota bacterium]|nr:hypothetical protein [Myxococcota bacterium]MBU1430356.1 hypothetical protein [Myxococcota bacterium]MBU1898182.1 hypothetical protein [Myxococcota bacterium]
MQTFGVFSSALRARRQEVLSKIDAHPAAARLSRFIFELFFELAPEEEVDLNEEVISGFAQRHQVSEDITLPFGRERFSILEAFDPRAKPPEGGQISAAELLSGLFARGFDEQLQRKNPVERRDFTVRVISLLPGVERFGPFILSDFIDLVCAEEDALRFWQIYVDRIATEISRRTRQISAARSEDSWLLSRLLRIHTQGPVPGRTGAWFTLKRHVNRVLQTQNMRWRFIRSLIEGSHDPRMLHYLCIAPGVVEEPSLIKSFLLKGNPKLVSCALFIIQHFGDQAGQVEETLAGLAALPLEESAPRLVDIYAQAHLPARPSLTLSRLIEGILEIAREQIEGGAAEPLIACISDDVRAMREVLLFAHLHDETKLVEPPYQQLLEQVVTVFLRSFTPSGIDHLLNDALFREAVSRAITALIGSQAGTIVERLSHFSEQLGGLIVAWVEAGEGRRHRLLGRSLGLFSLTLLDAARALYGRLETRMSGLRLYEILIQNYCRYATIGDPAGWTGALEHVIPALFADLIEQAKDEAWDFRRVEAAAELIAAFEEGRLKPEGEGFLAPPPQEHPGVRLKRPSRGAPLIAAVRVLRHTTHPLKALASGYLGLTLAREAVGVILGWMRLTTRAQLILTDRELVLRQQSDIEGEWVGREETAATFAQLSGVHVTQATTGFYLALGGGLLVTAALLGGALLFEGLRGREISWALLGGGLIGAGLLCDVLLSRLAARGRDEAILELRFEQPKRLLRLALNAEESAEVLESFMSLSAIKREGAWPDEASPWPEADLAWAPFEE